MEAVSLVSCIASPTEWSHVNVFTFGKSSIYGYDEVNRCVLISSTNEFNAPSRLSVTRLHLSAVPSWPIRRMIVNRDESLLVLLADRLAYLVCLLSNNVNGDEQRHSPSRGDFA
jgi:hypothetical protein